MTRREGSYSLPGAVAERLESELREFVNRNAAAALARLLARCHRYSGRTFACCRRALSRIADLGLSEDQVRGALAVLERIGFVERIGGGGFDRVRQQNRPVIWRLGWAARKLSPKLLSQREDRLGERAAARPPAPILNPSRGFRLCGLIPNGGDAAAVRMAARAALDRLKAAPVPSLSAAALAAGRWGKR